MSAEPCKCPIENPACMRAGQPTIGRLWEICSGNCPSSNPCSDYDSHQYRRMWDSWPKQAPRADQSSSTTLQEGEIFTPTAPQVQLPKEAIGLGDMVERALSLSRIGPLGKKLIEKWTGEPCNCPERVEKLNALGFWGKRVVSGKLEQAKEILSKIIGSQIPTELMDIPQMKWAYGITGIPSRVELLGATISSLKKAGFDQPDLFLDGCSHQKAIEFETKFGLRVSARNPAIRPFAHWVLTLWELYTRNPHCDRYAIFQDDILACSNLKAYLSSCQYPEKGYWNLYTAPENQGVCPRAPRAGYPQGIVPSNSGNPIEGWYSPTLSWKGIAALGLVFDKQSLLKILQARNMIEKPQDPHKGWRNIDGAVYTALDVNDYKEYVHNPSLLQHTGVESSIGNNPNKRSLSFRGEAWSPMSLIKQGV